MPRRLLTLACVALCSFTRAQAGPFDVVAALGRGRVAGEHHDGKLAFDYATALIRVAVKLGTQTCQMLVDTGAPMTVTPELARQLGLAPLGRFTTRDATGRARELEFVALPECDVGGVHYVDLAAVVVDLQALPILRAHGIDGLVGTNLLRLGAVAIDYDNRTIELAADGERLRRATGKSMPFTTSVQGAPYLQLQIGSQPQLRILLDTGCNGYLQLSASASGRLPTDRVPVSGSIAAGAFGKSGEGTFHCWLTGVTLGGESLADTVATVQADGEARLGNRFFDRTRIVLDWRKSQLWVEHQDRLGRPQLRTHGLALKYERDAVWVATVVADSPAAAGKLAIDQRVLAVGDLDLRTGDLAAFVRAVEQLQLEPAALEVTVERDGKPVVVKLEPQRLLPR